MKRIISTICITALTLTLHGQTLEACQQAAEHNYPLIRQYGLIEKTVGLTLSNLSKNWLPQVSASAQATYQSDVTAWPDAMNKMMQQMGIEMEGLKKDQYRVGIDIQQTVYDGGMTARQKEIAERQSQVETAQVEVNLYQVRQRVNEMYFALLLLDDQIQLNNDLQELLAGNEKKLNSMYRNGTAAESDYLNVKAERLNTVQQLTSLTQQRQTVARMLSTLCGIEVNHPEKPSADAAPTSAGQRPELRVVSARLSLADAKEKALNAALRPRLGVFAQGFYGYPGLNMFEDMMHRRWSLNGLIGARLTWNIGALYTRHNDKAKIQLERQTAETQRSVFLFNNQLEQMQHADDIDRYRQMMADDEEIITLRSKVRKAAESKLAHGIIDVNDLMREIQAENAAKVQQSIHEMMMLKEIYNLRHTTNQ